MSSSGLELFGAEVENLRSFDRTSRRLPLDRPVTLLVGPNNSGKTSLLRMLDWVLNGPIEQLEPDHPVSAEVVALLQPARDTRNKARRLTLRVKVLLGHGEQGWPPVERTACSTEGPCRC